MPLALDVSVIAGEKPTSSSSSPPRQQRFCVAWGGGATPGGAAPFLGVPAALAAHLKLEEGATVDVRPLLLKSAGSNDAASSSTSSSASSAPPPRATRVSVTPASADDWEVVQAQAGLLEETITSQVGVVSVGYPFPVFIPRAGGGGAPVSLVATAIEPRGFPVAFLGPGCEFVVAPVARRKDEGEGEGEEGNSSSRNESSSSSPSVSWLRVLPSAAARAASRSGARFASRRLLPLLLAETESMPRGKRLATVASMTAWAPRAAVEKISRSSSSSSSSPAASGIVVVALSPDLNSRSPKLYLALRAVGDEGEEAEKDGDGDGDGEASTSSSSTTFPLPPGHLSLPSPASRAAGVSPGKRAALRSVAAATLAAAAEPPSLVILRPDRGAVERRSGGGRGAGGGGSGGEREQQPSSSPPSHPVLSALSAAGPQEFAALFSAWLAAQVVASGEGGSAPVVVCDGALVRLALVGEDEEGEEGDEDQEEETTPSSSSSSPPLYLDFAIELRWPAGNRRPGTPVLLSPSSALRVELGNAAELLEGEESSPSPLLSWPDGEPLPPFGSSWTRTHLRSLLQPLRAPLDARARALIRAAGAQPATRAGGVVLVGARNAGKSALAAAAARAFARDPSCCAATVRVSCRDLVASAAGEGGGGGGGGNGGGEGGLLLGSPASARASLAASLRAAADSAPTLLVLDDVDALGSSSGGDEDPSNGGNELGSLGSALAAWLARSLRSLLLPPAQPSSAAVPLTPPPIALLATATDASAVPSCLRGPGLLETIHVLPPLGPRERRAVLRRALAARGVRASAAGVASVAAEAAEGCDAADVAALAERAIHAAVTRRLASVALGKGGSAGMSFGSGGAPPKISSSISSNRRSANSSSSSSSFASAASPQAGSGKKKKKKKQRGAFSPSSPLSLIPSLPSVAGAGAVRVCRCDFEEAARGFSPAAAWAAGSSGGGDKDSSSFSSSSLPRGWEDVGGMEAAREALTEALSLPLAAARLVRGSSGEGGKKNKNGKKKKTSSSASSAPPLRLRTGVLLFGPPGCGKTHAARAAVAAAGARCVTVKGPELLNKYIGASEAAVRAVFARARAAAPCVLFFDEFDSLAPSRGADSTGVTDRVVNALLTEIDGAEGLEGVVVVAASSRPDLVDAALLRPGRLDRMVFCGPPSGVEERRAVLAAAARRLVLKEDGDGEEEGKDKSSSLLLFDELALKTEGFSGADLGALLSEAALLAAREAVEEAEEKRKAKAVVEKKKEAKGEEEEEDDESDEEGEEEDEVDLSSSTSLGPPPITRAHLHAALAASRPSLPRSELAALEERYAAFRGTPRRGAPKEPAKGAHDPGDASKTGSRVTLK